MLIEKCGDNFHSLTRFPPEHVHAVHGCENKKESATPCACLELIRQGQWYASSSKKYENILWADGRKKGLGKTPEEAVKNLLLNIAHNV